MQSRSAMAVIVSPDRCNSLTAEACIRRARSSATVARSTRSVAAAKRRFGVGRASTGNGVAVGAPCCVVTERVADRRPGDVQSSAEVADAGAAGQLVAEPVV